MQDKYTATWVSHSSISDFLQCPRAYYLKNVYKDPQTNKKVQLVSPALSLGSAVHEVLESLSQLKLEERFRVPLIEKFQSAWAKTSGERGGFFSRDLEANYKARGEEMIRRVEKNPGPIERLAVKIQKDLPYFWLSDEDNIILCGKIDWLEYLPDTDSVHIIDFKTGKNEEDSASLQLPIYCLLATKCQGRNVSQASYWYLDFNDNLTPQDLPNLEDSEKEILKIARDISTARKLGRFKCPQGDNGCRNCSPFEKILTGNAKLVGEDEFGRMLYALPPESKSEDAMGSVIL